MKFNFLAIALAMLALHLALPNENAQAQATPPKAENDDAMRARSVVTNTDFARLQAVFAKARRGEIVTIASIGGSITAGASASTPEKRYVERVAQWWRDTFPKANIVFVNAGVGATTSQYGAARAQRDLLVHNPDFVITEYAVNDGNTREFAEHYEGLLRQILSQPQKPAALMVFMKQRGGGNAQEWQSRLGRHYGLPMISFRDGVQSEIDAGRMKEDDVMADVVHPNDRGHEMTAQFITRYLEDVLKATPADAKIPEIAPLSPPLISDVFARIRYFDGVNLKPTENKGWKFDAPNNAWIATQPGSVLKCDVEGEAVETMTFRLRGPMGRANVQVDDLPPVMIEGWFDQTWGGYIPTEVIARDLKPGKHTVKIEVLPEKAPKAPDTNSDFTASPSRA